MLRLSFRRFCLFDKFPKCLVSTAGGEPGSSRFADTSHVTVAFIEEPEDIAAPTQWRAHADLVWLPPWRVNVGERSMDEGSFDHRASQGAAPMFLLEPAPFVDRAGGAGDHP